MASVDDVIVVDDGVFPAIVSSVDGGAGATSAAPDVTLAAAADAAPCAAHASDDDAGVYLAPLGEMWSPESLVRAGVVLAADRAREVDAQRKINTLKRKFEEDCGDVLVARNKGVDRAYLRSVQLYESLMGADKGIVVTVSAWLDLR